MDGNIAVFLQLVFGTGISVHAVKECLDCPADLEPIENMGNFRVSMNFIWNCSLSSNQTLFGLEWWNDETRIASNKKGNFTADDSHAGRVKSFGTYGITLHNISLNDSGHYRVDIWTKTKTEENIQETSSCQIIFVPDLFLQVLTECHACTTTDNQPSKSAEAGSSKPDTGLICGIVIPIFVVTCIILYLVAWNFRRQRRKKTDMENTYVPNEMELLNK